MREHGGEIPDGVRRTVVPAAPDAWITALERHGTMGFGEVAQFAIRYARDGFAVNWLLEESLASHAADYARWPQNAAIYLPGGRPPRRGDTLRADRSGATIQFMADQEKRRRRTWPRRRAGRRARRLLPRRHRRRDRRSCSSARAAGCPRRISPSTGPAWNRRCAASGAGTR